MLEGWFVNNVLMHKEIRPYPQQPQETSGVVHGSDAVYRYSLKESEYPTLIIIDAISDGRGDIIPPGHYELALSDSMDFLIIMQSKQPIAIVPVFKIGKGITTLEEQRTQKYKRRQKKLAKERAKTNKKRAKVGMPPDEDIPNMEATIEYNEKGDYYLIKYEKGTIKAWGAIKRI